MRVAILGGGAGATATIDAIIQLASILIARDYAGKAPRTPESLVIGDLSVDELFSL